MSGFWSLPLVAIVAILLLGMAAAYEVGIRLHDRLRSRADNRRSGSSDEGFILSGVLGLLALLMAFAFSMSLNRYEDRRELLLAEANAISSFDVTAGAARQPSSDQLRRQLLSYGRARLAFSTSEGNAHLRAVEDRELAALESGVRQAMRAHEGTPVAVAIGQSFNVLADSASDRDALAAAHLPERVLALLATYCVVSAGMLGYAVASERSRHRVASSTLFLLLSLAFGTVLDLDRPRSGAITVSQEPLREAVRTITIQP